MAVIFGTRGRDILKGTSKSDLILAGDGDDKIDAGRGDDWVFAGDGNDYIDGGSGNDVLVGGAGDDVLKGDCGRDFMFGGSGNDVFLFRGRYDSQDLAFGGPGIDKVVNAHCSNLTFEYFNASFQSIEIIDARWRDIDGTHRDNVLDFRGATLVNFRLIDANGGDDVVYGSEGGETIQGDRGDDRLYGEGGDDDLDGGRGRDLLEGGEGDDVLRGGRDKDVIRGGEGDDTILHNAYEDWQDEIDGGAGYDSLVNAGYRNMRLESFGPENNIEHVDARWRDIDGTNGDNTLDFRGVELDRVRKIDAEDGDDVVYGSDGDDVIEGDDGDDKLYGEGGDDTLYGDRGRDLLEGGAGDDVLRGGRDKDVIRGGEGDDTILHSAREDWQDEIDGGEGYDSLVNAGYRNMKLDGFSREDTSIERIDAKWRDIDGTDGENVLDFRGVELDRVRKIDAENGDDVVYGSDGRDTIQGDDGDDKLYGEGGNDRLYGDRGDDELDGGAGSDKVYGGSGDDDGHFHAQENADAYDYYDGGRGEDTLHIHVTEEQYNSAQFQEELARYREFLEDNDRPWSSYGRSFYFESLDLKVRNWEEVEVHVEDGEPGGNNPPVAQDDVFTANEGNTMSGDVLANDHDPDNDGLTVTAVNGDAANVDSAITLASGAELTVNADGTFAYSTNGAFDSLGAGETHTETFTYTVADGQGGTATATATITVNGANDDPTAAADAATVSEDGSVSIDVLANDGDVDANDVLTVSGLDTSGTSGSVTLVGGQVVYDPNGQFESLGAGETATDSFSYTIDDGNGGTSTASVTVTITGVNDGPVAADDTASTSQDTAVDIDVLSNDSDPDANDVLSVTSASAANGSVVINADGSLTYTPDAGFSGSDTISYEISDGNGGTASATVDVTVSDTNDMPVAQDDSIAATEGNTRIGNVLSNDSDPDGDPLFVSAVNGSAANVGVQLTLASGAFLTVEANGDVTFVTNGAYNHLSVGDSVTESFTYTVSDGNGGTSTATARITVAGVNDDPTAAADAAATSENGSVSIDVLVNDSDVDANDSLSLASVDGTGLQGSVSIQGNQIVYDPSGQFESLAVGQSATETFSYTIDDGNGGTATANVTVTINGANDDPTAAADAVSVSEDAAGSVAVLGNDSDVDSGDSLSVSQVNGAAVAVGVPVALASNALVTLNADGTFSYDPNTQFESLGAGASATDSFTYTVSDGNGGTATSTVTVTVNGVNDDPTAAADAAAVSEDGSTSIDVLANDSDVDSGDSLSLASIDGTGLQGSVSIVNGEAVYDANGQFESLGAGETATETFSYTVTDANGGSSTANVTVTINGANDGPTAAADAASVGEDGSVSIDVLGNDSDVDANDTLSIASVDSTGLQGSVSIVGGQIVYNPNGQFESLAVGQSVTETFSYTVTDGNGGSSTASVTVTINGANDDPVAAADAAVTTEDGSVTIDVLGNDSDVDNGDSLSIASVDTSGIQGSVSIVGGQLVYDANGQFESLGAGETATETFSYTVTDGNGGSSTANVTVTVNGVNDDPTPADDAAVTDQDSAVVVNVLSNDGDPENDGLTVTAVGTANNGVAVLNPDNTVTYTPNAGFSGSDTFTYTVSDGNGGTSQASVTVTVNPVAPPPSGPTVINVGDLDGSNGFALPSDQQNDASDFGNMGQSISLAGDVNGDGFADFLVSDPDAELSTFQPNFPDSGGVTYLVFGNGDPDHFTASFDVRAEPSDGNAIQLFGAQLNGNAGASIGGGGDINGDGYDDIIIGEPGSGSTPGRVFVVFGEGWAAGQPNDPGFVPNLELEFLDASNPRSGHARKDVDGFEIIGEASGDDLGAAVANAGDFDGDGLADIIIGAPGGNGGTGAAYVIFDASDAVNGELQLSGLEANQGLKLVGFEAGSEFGAAVSGAGDINGDGLADVVVGARSASPGGQFTAGQAFVIFGSAAYAGSAGAAAQELDVSTLDGTNGFILNGINGGLGPGQGSGDMAGFSVSVVGDVDGDGYDDLLIGARFAEVGATANAGQAYLVYGGAGGFASTIDLQALDGSNGYAINGIDANDWAGISVSGAGDVNGDGLADIIIGAQFADPGGLLSSGEAYVVYGQAGRSFSSLDLADLLDTGAGGANEGGQMGFVIEGDSEFGWLGSSVSGIGDINGDGFDDIAVGARNANADFNGESYVIFGGNFTGDVTQAGTSGADVLTGSGVDDNMLGGAGNDTMDGGAGNDRLVGGTGDDSLTGGSGNDVYVFDANDGADVLEDFELYDSATQTGDRIDLSNVAGVESFADLNIQDVGGDGNADILLGNGNSITLIGVNSSALDADDFLF